MTALTRVFVSFILVASVAGVAVTTASAAPVAPSGQQFEPGALPARGSPADADPSVRDRTTMATPPEPLGDRVTEGSLGDTLADSALVDAAIDDPSAVTDVVGVIPFLAGYSRFGGTADPLAHETRATIYETVREEPGIYVAKLARATDTPVSTVRYHTRVLVREGLVDRTTERGRSRLVPAQQDDAVLAVDDGTRRDILVALAERGPATGSDLAAHLDLSKSTVSYHLDRLEADGLVDRNREGRTVDNALTTAARRTLAAVADD